MGNATKKVKNKLLRFWPLLVIFGLMVAFAFPFWAKNKVPFPANYLVNAFPPWQYYYGLPVKNNAMPDVVTQMYPFKHLVIGLWKKGQTPLWNPYNFSGNPLSANYQSAVFHPANFLFFLLPEIDAWSVMILMQSLLAGLFTYFFCRQLKISKAASLLSSIAFMFCGFITVWMAYGTLSFALLWLPLVLYAIERSFAKLSPFSLILISFSLVASFFSGHFQTSLYVFLVGGIYLVFKWLVSRNSKVFFLCSFFIILGLGLASIQILPSFELHQLSVRSHRFNISETIPWRYLITILAPDFYGNPVTRNDRFHYAEWAGFAGVIPFILAFYVVLRKRSSSVRFFASLAVISLLLTLPTPILDLITKLKIPVLATSAASRVISIFSFSIAILAGAGFDQLKNDLTKRKLKPALLVSLSLIFLFLVVWGILLVGKPFESVSLSVTKRNFILPTGMVTVFGGLILVFWLIQNFFKKNKFLILSSKFLILSVILLLTVFDLFRFAHKWMPFDPREHVYPSLPILEFLTKKIGSDRPANRADRLFGQFGMEMQNYYQVPGFNGYDPMYIQRYGELLTAANNGKVDSPPMRGVDLAKRGKYTMPLLNLLGAKYVLHAIPDDRYVWAFPFWEYPTQFKQIYQDDTYEVYENLDTFPRVFMAYDYRVAKESQEIIDEMFALETDLRKTLILEEEPALAKLVPQPQNPAEVKILNYSPNQINLEVQTKTLGLLFLSDNYYPGWKAFVDGKQTKIYRADYSFRAVAVSEGNHKIDFFYQPFSFKIGLGISLASLVIVFLSLFFLKKKNESWNF